MNALITQKTIRKEQKGIDAFEIQNHSHFVIAGEADWVVPAGVKERRYCVLKLANDHIQDHGYFAALRHQMEKGGTEALLQYLKDYDIAGINLRCAPSTEGLREQQQHSLDDVWSYILDRLSNEVVLRGQFSSTPWTEEPIETAKVQDDYLNYARSMGISRRAREIELGNALGKIGVRKKRYTLPSGSRAMCYHFPAIGVARQRFDAHLGTTIDWPKDEEEEDQLF